MPRPSSVGPEAFGRLALELAAGARAEGREALTDLEGLRLLDALGLERPAYVLARDGGEAAAARLPGERVVVKVASPEILHKTEVGGVAIVPNEPAAVAAAVEAMRGRFAGKRVEGYTVNEFVAYGQGLGHELILGYRFAPDFGPVVTFGPGGIHAEFLARNFREGSATLFVSPATADRALVEMLMSRNAMRALASGGLRNTAPLVDGGRLVDLVMAFLGAAPLLAAAGISEFEVNPFVIAAAEGGGHRLVALDVLAKLSDLTGPATGLGTDGAGRIVNRGQAARPLAKLDRLLEPRSAAIVGVSEKGMNNGRVILGNLLHDGFDRSRLYVVKPGSAEVDGCACFPDLESLPEKVDLLVLVIPAAQAAESIASAAELDAAEAIIVIPGGLEEKGGTGVIVARMRAALEASRSRPGGGPLVNGGNCLGIRSVPGRYNTLFIPGRKLPLPAGPAQPLALISQSGAFAICRVSKHPGFNPKYLVTCGNQMDLTVGDWLERLGRDGEVGLFAVYVEGFKPLDGEKLLRAARDIVASGRTVVFYRAGRTAAGALASASHTASIAGDWPVTAGLLEGAGAVVARSLDDFDDALATFHLLRDKSLPPSRRERTRASRSEAQNLAEGTPGPSARLGALSNAGFECVAFADNLGPLELAPLDPVTIPRLEAVFAKARISGLVDLHNPIDLTPMAGDEAYEEAFRALLDDPNVDCGIVGVVPLTAALETLAADPARDGEDASREGAIAVRLGRLMGESTKPWVAVVDSGRLYDAFALELESRGVPTFRSADRALAALGLFMEAGKRAG